VVIDQIRTVSKSRLGAFLGKLDATAAAEVRAVIRQLYAES
jgi:mRNA-degrading endonuclease toxin of MazEF toxin-antitoxin module